MPFDRRGGTVPRRLAAAAVALLPGAGGARAQRTESLSSKANNPIAPLTQILFRNEATLSYYDRDTTGDGVRFRATIPFRAWRRDNLLRVDLPFGVGGAEGRGSGPSRSSISRSSRRAGRSRSATWSSSSTGRASSGHPCRRASSSPSSRSSSGSPCASG